MTTTINGEGRTQCGGRVCTKDYGDGRGDEEARVARLGSDSEDTFVIASESLVKRDFWSSTALHLHWGRQNLIGLVARECMWRQDEEEALSMDKMFWEM